ncbi:hypothetical protein Y032_0001g20 [Ancylostoma ceylanicum]|nr:hypothetical protein Y032_0001g20 [Ancylostoma ceylanicum]
MVSLLTFRFPVAGWSAVLNKPYIAKIGFVASQYTCLLELFAQLSLSINRFTAITVPLKHNHLFEQQAFARRLQLNLLVYSSSFTLAVISMTICQAAELADSTSPRMERDLPLRLSESICENTAPPLSFAKKSSGSGKG